MNNIPYQKLLAIAFMLCTVRLADAQEMSMTMHHHSSSAPKNSFLIMMDTMMVKMDKAPKTGSAELDFISQMIPHHEGAIEMAAYEIQYGKDFTMIQLAKSILAEQKSELQQMHLWLQQSTVVRTAATAEFQSSMDDTMDIMMKTMPENSNLTNVDQAFASVMRPHHQAAIDMAKVVLRFSRDQQTNAFANGLISSEQVEIEQMSLFLKQ